MTRNEIALACMGAATLLWCKTGSNFGADCDEVIVDRAFELADAFMAEIDGKPDVEARITVTP